MLTTKEFADLCKTTKRTIIHYDQLGLLKPAKREKLNRYYTPRQVLKFEKINLLQSVGFSLSEIRQKLANHQTLTKIFIENKQKIAEKQRQINEQMEKVTKLLNNLEQHKTLIAPKIKQIPSYDFYGITREGKYAEINKFCKELAIIIGDKQSQFIYFVIFTDFFTAGYSPTKSQMIIGAKPAKNIHLPEKQNIKLFHVPKFTALTSLHTGSHGFLGYLWEFMEDYLRKNKIIFDAQNHPREIYLQGPANEKYEERYVTELQIPLVV